MKLTFIGAAHEVTGSCTLLEIDNKNYLIDCGMEQGKNFFENIELPIAAADIQAVFLTHAHIDHSGMIPLLYKNGFCGKVYCTDATKKLCSVMLLDSAHIQQLEAEWKTRKALRSGRPAVEPTYDTNDVEGVLKLFCGCSYGETYKINDNISMRFTDVGHLLGSACIEVFATENGAQKSIVFSGDIGNINHPIINDPKTIEGADYAVIESTYGNRLHEVQRDTVSNLTAILQRAFDRGGNVVIPSFAVGRTQELLYVLAIIKNKGLIRGHSTFPVYVDSPLAVEATNIFLDCDISYFDKEMREMLEHGINPIWNDDLVLSVTSDESKLINADTRPKVILSASGMCEAGRIRHHLKHNLWREENIILFVGYQSEGSVGRQLLEGAQSVKLFGEDITVNAEICSLQGTSGHADKNGLLSWLNSMQKKPTAVFVNHGDEQSCEDFKNTLINEFGYNALAPYSGTEFDLILGSVITNAEGKRIVKSTPQNEDARRIAAFSALTSSADELARLVKTLNGRPNKELIRLTREIKELIEKAK